MNKTATIVFIIVLAIVGVVLFKKSSPKAEATLTGTVTYLERIALPSGSKVEVEIRDVSRADAPAETIASTAITTSGENVPIPFTIEYDPTRVSSTRTYSVFARILVNDQLRWVTPEHVSFLVNGIPRAEVDLTLSSTGGTSQQPSSPSAPTTPTASLNGTTFRLVSFNGTTVPQGTDYILNFENGRVGAKFCNSMGGEYTLSNGFIKVPQMVSTLMFCSAPRDLMDIENLFSHLMSKGAAFSFVGSTLVIADAQNNMTFTVFMD